MSEKNNEFSLLNEMETDQVSGGFAPIAIAIGAAYIAGFAAGFGAGYRAGINQCAP